MEIQGFSRRISLILAVLFFSQLFFAYGKEEVLERAGIKTAGYLLAALDDSSNVFVSLTSKMLNPSLKIVCKIEDVANEPKLKKVGADEVVCCHDMGARMMLEFAGPGGPREV
jgi:voltage-gated potassium channel Kch